MRNTDHQLVMERTAIAATLRCGIDGKFYELEVPAEPLLDDMSGRAGAYFVRPPLPAPPCVAVCETD